MPNYAKEVRPGIWRWEGEYFYVDSTGKWVGPFTTQDAALTAKEDANA